MAPPPAHVVRGIRMLVAASLAQCAVGGRLLELAGEGVVSSRVGDHHSDRAYLEVFQDSFVSTWWVHAGQDVLHGEARSISFAIRIERTWPEIRYVQEATVEWYHPMAAPFPRSYSVMALEPESVGDKGGDMRMCVKGRLERSAGKPVVLIFCRRENDSWIAVLVRRAPTGELAAHGLSPTDGADALATDFARMAMGLVRGAAGQALAGSRQSYRNIAELSQV
mmetsp:Transcript_58440/g.161661  ORF Transcript_58440/g.161661 Transcript_58440/m.161661 type:complete len:223 (+) Transcript_58440:48-716(+)